MFSTMGDIIIHVGRYHDACGGYYEYCGRVQYHGSYHEYHGDIMSPMGGVQYCGDIMSTMGVFSTMEGYHDACGGIS